MENCPKCEAKIQPGELFCSECGFELPKDEPDFSAMQTLGGLETIDDTVVRKDSKVIVLKPGTVFADRYEIQDVIGRGGMGVVYKAADLLTKQTVALKLIRPERLSGTNAIEKLIAEGVTARDIRHPNIVAVYDVGQSEGQPFVSMEYLEGKSLRAWQREQKGDVPLRVAARIMAEIMDGLNAAHKAGVVHRDLKPENIVMMSSHPTEESAPLKILDFGIARATGAALESGTGTGLGTPRYMAPEQITNADSAGPPADIYSSSVMFYELLVGVLPQGHWQPPSGGRSDVPIGIDELIEKGLSNRPANRAQSATEYRKSIVDAVNISKPSLPFKFDLDPKYKKWGGIAAAVVIGLVLIDTFIPDPVDNPCEGLSGQFYNDCMGFVVVGPGSEGPGPVERDDPPDDPPEDPPPRANPFASINGEWNYVSGSSVDVTISRSGNITGSGSSADGYNTTIRGSISGVNGTFTLSTPQLGLRENTQFVWSDECHLSYRILDETGIYVLGQGVLHVNHPPIPGLPCPS